MNLLMMTTKAYRVGLVMALTLVPSAVAANLWASGAGAQVVVAHYPHAGLVALSIALAGFVSLVTWSCYRATREPFLRWLFLGFICFAVVYAPHGLLTGHADDNSLVFLLYGPASRISMLGFLAVAMLRWGTPADARDERRPGRWLPWAVLILALPPTVALAASSPWAPSLRLVGEAGTVGFCGLAAVVVLLRPARNSQMWLSLAAIALFAQASLVFAFATPWTQMWWLAHLIFASGFLLLSYGVVRAFHSTRSFSRVFSEEEMIARLAASTAQAQAEHRNAQRLRGLFGASPDGILVVSDDGSVLFENPSAAELADHVAPDGRLAPALNHLVGDQPQGAEVELRFGAEGCPIWVSVSWAPFAFEHEAAVVLWLHDVTARKEGEQALRAAMDSAERANAAKSRFLAAASHDIRQPLVPIKLLAELLEDEVSEPGSVDLLGKMRVSLQSLDEMVARLLDFSRLELGAMQATEEAVALGPVLTRFRHEFEPVARAKGLDLRVVDCAASVRTDRVLLEQILRNLIENAIRYTDTGKVLIGCRRRGDAIRLSVLDTGIGIAADQHEAVFGEFYQVGNQNRDRRQGLGLGLATVDRLCRLLGHPLVLESGLGRGSVFSLEMPRIVAPARARVARLSAVRDPGSLRVLLVEDDPEAREAVAMILGRWGWGVTAVACCAEALASVASDGPPDVVVTDLRLEPELSGLDVLRRLADLNGGELPAVIVTGDNSHQHLAEANDGHWPVLIKPFAAQQLRDAVAEALATGRLAAAS